MLKHAAEAPSPPPPTQKSGIKDGCKFQRQQCENTINSKRKLKKHMRNQHTNLEEPRDEELVLEQEEISHDFKCEHCEKHSHPSRV